LLPSAAASVVESFPMKRFVVIGLGNFGSSAALALHNLGHHVVAIDSDPEKTQRLAEKLGATVAGDATEVHVLEEIGAGNADAGIVSTGRDVTASLLSALALRDCGVREIHVKVVSELHARILETLGVADSIFPEREAAQLLAKRVSSREILNYVDLGAGFSAQEMVVPPDWIGRSLRELELPRRHGTWVVAVRDYLTGETRPAPDPDAPLKESDALLVAGRDESLARLVAD
jgi:trk/ktr system potassium uptake protein